MNERFQIIGIRPVSQETPSKRGKKHFGKPLLPTILLSLVITGCMLCDLFLTKDPSFLDLQNSMVPPNREFLFGTDTMGRDLFSMVWYGGRISLTIGFLSTILSTGIAILFGAASGSAPAWLDRLLMRFLEILLSVPNLLLVILLQAVLGGISVFRISFVIGVTSWMSIAKIVRTEVRRLRNCEYIIAAKCMGGGFFYLLWRHFTPNLIPSILFMVVMNIRSAVIAESTLSFMGIGLPLEIISWGSMLSLSDKALLTGAWWIIFIPGSFLIVTLLCITSLANSLRKNSSKQESNL